MKIYVGELFGRGLDSNYHLQIASNLNIDVSTVYRISAIFKTAGLVSKRVYPKSRSFTEVTVLTGLSMRGICNHNYRHSLLLLIKLVFLCLFAIHVHVSSCNTVIFYIVLYCMQFV